LKKVRVIPKLIPGAKKHETTQATSLVFCEKATGIAQFQAESGADLHFAVERMASLLAMQCLVRGCEPGDYAILVPADRSLTNRLTARAKELLAEGLALANPVALSPRQREILHAVVCNRANKEIAAKLNITVRTVKFHISSLLSKFGVDNRAELARRATGFLRSGVPEGETVEFDAPAERPKRPELAPVALDTTLHVTSKSRGVRFPQRMLSA
jgi:DNA-binding CsgD family transcriptional regulator